MRKENNEKLFCAIQVISRTDEGKVFFDWLKKIQDDGINLVSYTRDDIELRWVQGKLQFIEFINKMTYDAINPVVNNEKESINKSLLY